MPAQSVRTACGVSTARAQCAGNEAGCEGVCTDPSMDPRQLRRLSTPPTSGTPAELSGPANPGIVPRVQAGQTKISGHCTSDIAIRSTANQTGSSGTATISAGTIPAGDTIFAIVSPTVSGFYSSSVTSSSGGTWNLVGLGNDAGQYLAVYSKVATAGDSGGPITVTLTRTDELERDVVSTCTLVRARRFPSTRVPSAAPSWGRTRSMRESAPPGQRRGYLRPDRTRWCSSSPRSQGLAYSDAPTGVATTPLTQNGGFVTGYYSLALPGQAPTQQFTGGNSGATWELAQIVLASSAH